MRGSGPSEFHGTEEPSSSSTASQRPPEDLRYWTGAMRVSEKNSSRKVAEQALSCVAVSVLRGTLATQDKANFRELQLSETR